MSDKLALLQPEETKCTALAFIESKDLLLDLNGSVTIYDQKEHLQVGNAYLARVLANAGFVQVGHIGRLENILTGSYLFGEPVIESEATHAYINFGDTPASELFDLDVWIETDISIRPKSTRKVQGKLGTKSKGLFETAFGNELVNQGVEG